MPEELRGLGKRYAMANKWDIHKFPWVSPSLCKSCICCIMVYECANSG